MSDDCGVVENITAGGSFDYSCDTQTSNDYSSVNDCTSNVHMDNDCSGVENTSSAVENISELVINVETIKSTSDDSKTASHEYSPTKLQANEITSKNKFLKSQSIEDIPSSINYIRRSDRTGNNHCANNALSEAYRIRMKEEHLKNSRMQNEQIIFRRRFFGILIVTIVISFLFILLIYIITFANYPIESIYKSSMIKPLPHQA